jgi:hypothetical protein
MMRFPTVPLKHRSALAGAWLVVVAGLGVAAGCTGCGEDPVEAPKECSALTGPPRDVCLNAEIAQTPGSQPDVVLQKAPLIKDPMIRQAAVSQWVKEHVREIPNEKGQELCNLLEGRDRSYCQRVLSSPHLQED